MTLGMDGLKTSDVEPPLRGKNCEGDGCYILISEICMIYYMRTPSIHHTRKQRNTLMIISDGNAYPKYWRIQITSNTHRFALKFATPEAL